MEYDKETLKWVINELEGIINPTEEDIEERTEELHALYRHEAKEDLILSGIGEYLGRLRFMVMTME